MFKKLLLAAVDESYDRSLRDKYVRYANVTTLTILNHLYNSYARITAQDLKENNQRFNSPYDSNETIETLIDQIENAINYVTAGNFPYTPLQIVMNVCNLIFETRLYDNACRE